MKKAHLHRSLPRPWKRVPPPASPAPAELQKPVGRCSIQINLHDDICIMKVPIEIRMREWAWAERYRRCRELAPGRAIMERCAGEGVGMGRARTDAAGSLRKGVQ